MTGFASIISRELIVGARQKATHRARLFAGATTIGIFTVILLFTNSPVQFVGPTLFGIVYFILFLQAIFAGVRLTADCLSEEKREGTLGLLYLSGLRGAEIVLGKLAVRALRASYAMLATLPVFGSAFSSAASAASTLSTPPSFSSPKLSNPERLRSPRPLGPPQR